MRKARKILWLTIFVLSVYPLYTVSWLCFPSLGCMSSLIVLLPECIPYTSNYITSQRHRQRYWVDVIFVEMWFLVTDEETKYRKKESCSLSPVELPTDHSIPSNSIFFSTLLSTQARNTISWESRKSFYITIILKYLLFSTISNFFLLIMVCFWFAVFQSWYFVSERKLHRLLLSRVIIILNRLLIIWNHDNLTISIGKTCPFLPFPSKSGND